MLTSDKYREIHAEAIERFDRAYEACEEERRLCMEDRRFATIPGAMWEDNRISQTYDGKPKFEINKLQMNATRIANNYRRNRLLVKFLPEDGNLKQKAKLADALAGRYRADLKDSNADEAFDNAFDEKLNGGMGAWRLVNQYEDESDPENDKQRIAIKPIFDADVSVFFDPDDKTFAKTDSRFAFVITTMSEEAYEEAYDDKPSNWTGGISTTFDWTLDDKVRIAEYYVVEDYSRTKITYQNAIGGEVVHYADEFKDNPELEGELAAIGHTEVGRRKIKQKRVRKHILSGGGVLEDVGYIAGPNIPIVPTYGKRWFIDGVERCAGNTRLGKDPQRLYNMEVSKLALISQAGGIEKPIFTPEQMAGHEAIWAKDHVTNYPYLLVNPIENADGTKLPAGPVAFTKSPTIPPAQAALLALMDTDIQNILGNPATNDKLVANVAQETAEMFQTRTDSQNDIYTLNMQKSMKRCGEIWLGMAKEIYVESGRNMKILNENGEPGNMMLNQDSVTEGSEIISDGNLWSSRFSVEVDVGPSTTSQKQAVMRTMTNLLGVATDPETQQVVQAMIMMNTEGEGMGDIQAYFREKLVRMGVLQPTQEEKEKLMQELQNQQPDPNRAYIMAAAEKETALAIKAKADTLKVVADTGLAEAKTEETLAGIQSTQRQEIIDNINLMQGQLAQMQGIPDQGQQTATPQTTPQPTMEPMQ